MKPQGQFTLKLIMINFQAEKFTAFNGQEGGFILPSTYGLLLVLGKIMSCSGNNQPTLLSSYGIFLRVAHRPVYLNS